MKKVLGLCFVLMSVTPVAFAGGGTVGSDSFSRSECASKVDIANQKAQYQKFELEAGAASRYDVAKAQLDADTTQLDCQTITIDTFCNEGPALAQELFNLQNAAWADAAATKLDVLNAQSDLNDIKARCQ